MKQGWRLAKTTNWKNIKFTSLEHMRSTFCYTHSSLCSVARSTFGWRYFSESITETKKEDDTYVSSSFFGLSDWTWTSGPLNPIQVLYQTELHPDIATLKLPIIYYQKHSEMSILNWFIMNIYAKIPYIINVLTIIFWFVIIIMETRLLWKVWKGECVVDCKRIWDE